MGQRARTLKHVPKASRDLWAQAVCRSLAAIVAYNSETAWMEWAMLPKTVLLPPPRGGHKNAKAAAAFTNDRLTRWLAGERMTLWEDVCAHAPPPQAGGPSTEAQRMKRAVALAAEGFDRKACSALLSTGLCDESEDTAAKLRDLHPAAAEPACPEMASLPMACDIGEDMVQEALLSFPRDSAPGPSALRVQHLLEAQTPSHKGAVLEQLCGAIQLAVRGEVPRSVAPFLAGASLLALPKVSGGIRPIAIGEVFRRLVGKCLCAAVKEQAQQYFQPRQVGVATPLGVDAAIHAVTAWMQQAGPGQAFLKIDFANAFNCIDRGRALEAVRARFPELARWTQWCYGQPSHLTFGTHTLSSSSGVQQGDPLGPLVFATAAQPLVERLGSLTVGDRALEVNTFYLDDGGLGGICLSWLRPCSSS